MQQPIINLQEIIWEITGKCHNGCEYCGSSHIWGDEKEIDEDRIIQIAKKIADYPPKEIDISGGDPLLVSYKTHKKIIDILRNKGIKCKILINLKSLRTCSNSSVAKENDKILELYDHIGLSINTSEDLETMKEMPRKWFKTTVITNFNLQNIFLFNKIETLVQSMDVLWMVQYTIFNSFNSLALYENLDAVDDLRDRIENAYDEGIKILISDNMSGNPCVAGSRAIGILYNGDVVPCLSMRSWHEEIPTYGNVLDTGLEKIWVNGFKEYRCSGFKCCKDVCNNQIIGTYKIQKQDKFEITDEKIDVISKGKDIPYKPDYFNGTFVYAVPTHQDPIVLLYAVQTIDLNKPRTDEGILTTSSKSEVYTRIDFEKDDDNE